MAMNSVCKIAEDMTNVTTHIAPVAVNDTSTPGVEAGPGYNWSMDLPKDPPGLSGRTPGLETLRTGGEKINADENYDMLRRLFENMDEASRVDRQTMAEAFEHGKTGTYVTRSKTLLQRVREIVG